MKPALEALGAILKLMSSSEGNKKKNQSCKSTFAFNGATTKRMILGTVFNTEVMEVDLQSAYDFFFVYLPSIRFIPSSFL